VEVFEGTYGAAKVPLQSLDPLVFLRILFPRQIQLRVEFVKIYGGQFATFLLQVVIFIIYIGYFGTLLKYSIF
jgi:hypothetical protein